MARRSGERWLTGVSVCLCVVDMNVCTVSYTQAFWDWRRWVSESTSDWPVHRFLQARRDAVVLVPL